VRVRPPTTRAGRTSKITVGAVTLYLTLNRAADGALIEVFGKADEGYQGQLDGLCIVTSLALQHGCPSELIARHLRHRRYPPYGIAGQPCSISDALARALEGERG